MLENRSFDHFLGSLPNLDGINPQKPGQNQESPTSKKLYKQTPDAVRELQLDPMHDVGNVQRQIHGDGGLGPMGGFVYDYSQGYRQAPGQWAQVMSYFSLGALPALHELARAFCVCDRWFSSVPGPTWTNRFFAHSGTSQGWVNMPEPPFHWNLHRYDQTTIYDRLNERNVSWAIYAGDIPQSLVLYNQRQLHNLQRYHRMSTFYSDVHDTVAAQFPAYTFIEPCYLSGAKNDQHPPHDVLNGDDLIASVYNALRANTELWDSTLLMVTWDEHGGFYDHRMPPNPATPPDQNAQEGFAFNEYGVRVPSLMISKWVLPGSVFPAGEGVIEHTSVLRYLIDRFSLRPLTQRVSSVASIGSAIVTTPNENTPTQVGQSAVSTRMAPGTALAALNRNQIALMDFARYLETQSGVDPAVIGQNTIREAGSPGAAVEVAIDRAWRFIDGSR
jgi:phospholipase C